jgi:hypothetical protein
MLNDLPDDLLAFLADGRQLDFDSDGSDIGPITLKHGNELTLTTIAIPPGCQSIIDDPYDDLEGSYLVEVVDLVADSEDYDPRGLLSWIVSLRRFGCLDAEHGDVLTFPGARWTDIVNDPLTYLDAQWGGGEAGERVLPWLHFDFRVKEGDRIIRPYSPLCPVHHTPISIDSAAKPLLYDVFRRREMNTWLSECLSNFPCAGVPISDGKMQFCSQCRDAEMSWLARIERAIETLDARSNSHGWVACPGCGIRFMLTDRGSFQQDVHLTCGQKIRVVK